MSSVSRIRRRRNRKRQLDYFELWDYILNMTTLTVGALKSRFSEVLSQIENGREFAVSYGRKKQKVAVIIPFKKYQKTGGRKLGLLNGKLAYRFMPDFKMSDTELLDS